MKNKVLLTLCVMAVALSLLVMSTPAAIKAATNIMYIKPWLRPLETEVELVGADETIVLGLYGQEAEINFGYPTGAAGVIDSVCLFASAVATGTIQDSAGSVMFWNTDPALTAGGETITTTALNELVAEVTFYASDWITSSSRYFACKDPAAKFGRMDTLYVAWKHSDSTTLNDVAADNDVIDVNVIYSLWSAD